MFRTINTLQVGQSLGSTGFCMGDQSHSWHKLRNDNMLQALA